MLCYWNGCIKDGPDGPFYEGSSPRVIRVESKISLPKLLDDLHGVTGFEKGKFKIDVIGRYPSIVQQPVVKYIRLPVVDDSSLETMLEVPTYHFSINNVEFYLEVTPVVSDQGDAPRKRPRQEDDDANDLSDSVPKELLLSSSWLDERELRVGMVFKDKDELVKAVELYSCRRQRKSSPGFELYSDSWVSRRCAVGYKNCRWSLEAKITKGNGYEITKYNGPHTCEPVDVGSDFLAAELEGLLKARPSLSVPELNKWVKEEFGYTVSRAVMWDAKKEATTAIWGDSEKSFSVLPKFMASLCSSNKMRLEWQYDLLPDPKEASFRSVFWAFHQSVEGFPYCRPVIIVDAVDCGKHSGKLLVAAGFDAENQLFPLAFAVVSQEKLSADSWRWFFSCIRKKATHREGLCLITAMDPDIITAVNEPECRWAQHRFCLRHLCFEFFDAFHNNLLTEFVYKAGSTGCVSSFDYYLKKIEEMNPEARKWLDKTPPHKWALAHDDGGLRFGIMETNLIFATYGFINYLPITTCVLLIFDHLAELFISQRGRLSESLKSGDKYAQHVMTKLGEDKGKTYDALPLDNTGERFQVADGNNKIYVVHRIDRVCSCGMWQLYKYPCSHVLAVCRRLNIDFLQYVNDYYNTERSLRVYAAKFNPVPGWFSEWSEASETPRLFPPSPTRLDCAPSSSSVPCIRQVKHEI